MKYFILITIWLVSSKSYAAGARSSNPEGCTLDPSRLHIEALVAKYLPRGSNGRGSAAGVYKVSSAGSINQKLFEKNSQVAQAVASTQKIVTAFVAIQRSDLSKSIQFSSLDLDFDEEGNRGIYRSTGKRIEVGDKVQVSDLLYTLMMQSSNGAAQALSRSLASGSTREFVDTMNLESDKILGKQNSTHFQNPHGLTDTSSKYRFSSSPGTRQQSTAYEMATLLGYFMSQEKFRKALQTSGLSGVSEGSLAKPGSTQAAGKTFVYRFALPSNKCGTEAITMAMFGDDSSNQFDRMRQLMLEIRDDIFDALGVSTKSAEPLSIFSFSE